MTRLDWLIQAYKLSDGGRQSWTPGDYTEIDRMAVVGFLEKTSEGVVSFTQAGREAVERSLMKT